MKKQTADIKDSLWAVAEQLRANGSLKLNEIGEPILGLIFLKFADVKFKNLTKVLVSERSETKGRQRPITSDDYKSRGVIYLPEKSSYNYLLTLSEDSNIGKAINEAMENIERENTELAGVLTKEYTKLSSQILQVLLKNFSNIPDDISGDAFGEIYEYFLGEFARAEGQKGGEFFTPQSIVNLIVEILEPYEGSIFDPACGSGGMFVASANFVRAHTKSKRNIMNEVRIFGQEKGEGNVRIAKMNLAIHGLSGKIEITNSFYADPHKSIGKFDYVLANPPFNVKGKDKKGQTVINGNYLWIQMFASTLSDRGRAGFVMANSASDAGNSELEIRKSLIESGIVDCIVSVGSNMFLNATLPCTLWFFDKRKKGTSREKKILFVNVADIFTPIDRAHNTWTPEQIQEISGIVRSYREEDGSEKYEDKKARCKVSTIDEIAAAGYSLNPGRYVGTIEAEVSHENFTESIKTLQSEFEALTKEAHALEKKITENFKKII